MKPEKLIEVLSVAERLKDAVRHSYTSGGRWQAGERCRAFLEDHADGIFCQ